METVLIRPLPRTTPARAEVYRVGVQERKIDEGPSDPDTELKTFIRGILKKELGQGVRHFLLDLQAVEWIDSTYVGMILAWHQLVDHEGGEFALINLSKRSRDIMSVTRLDTALKVFATQSEAVSYFSRPAR
jgi:anti-sigma B factor antagonist